MRSLIPSTSLLDSPSAIFPATDQVEKENLFQTMMMEEPWSGGSLSKKKKSKTNKSKTKKSKTKKSKTKKSREPAKAPDLVLRLIPSEPPQACRRSPIRITGRLTDAQQINRLTRADSIHLVWSSTSRASLRKKLLDSIVLDVSKSGNWSPDRFGGVSGVSIWAEDDPVDRAYAFDVAQEIMRSENRRAKIEIYVADFKLDLLQSSSLIWSSTWDGVINRQAKLREAKSSVSAAPVSTFELNPFKRRRSMQPVQWVWDNILPRGGTAIIGGIPGSGKSATSLGLASGIENGDPFGGRLTTQGSVVYVAFEGIENAMLAQLAAMGGRDVRLIHSPSPQTADEGIAAISKLAVTLAPSLIIVDILQKLLNGINISSGLEYERTSDAMGRLSWIAKYTNTSFVFLHHAGNAGEILGNKALTGAVDCVLLLSERHVLRSVKQRVGEGLDPVKLRYDSRSLRFVGDGSPAGLSEKSVEILEAIGSGEITNAVLRKKFGSISGKTFNALIGQLVASGEVVEFPAKKKSETVYTIREQEEARSLDTVFSPELLDIDLDT